MLDKVFQIALCVASAATVVHLLWTGLFRKYRIFFLYLIVRTPYVAAPLFMDVTKRAWYRLWLYSEPVFCLLYILIVFELYRLVLANYKGLQTVGRWAMYVISAISVLISGLMLLPHIGPTTPARSKEINYVLALQRGVDTSLIIFLVLMVLFLSRYPIRLSRNVRVYAFVYPIFFLSSVFQALMFTLFDMQFGAAVNLTATILSVASTIAFFLLLTPRGEVVPETKSQVTPEHTRALLVQLEALNTTLLRVSRR